MRALTPRREALARLSAALASRNSAVLEEALAEAGDVAPPVEVEEAILQSYLFLGYPVALNGLAAWRAAAGGGAVGEASAPDLEAWKDRGETVCRAVYGGQYDGLRANVRRLHPDVEAWMVTEGYGKVLGRADLDLVTRELCIVAQLVVLDVPRQLYSHLRGALNVGASETQVSGAVALGIEVATEAAKERAEATWRAVRERRGV